MPEEREVSIRELVHEYPILEEWFANPSNIYAQLQGDKRLMSAEEKLALVGGEDQVKANLRVIPSGWRDQYTILLACRQEPMVGMEILHFSDRVSRRLSIGGMYFTIKGLLDLGELSSIYGLTYAYRIWTDPERFLLRGNARGFLTTEQGIREIVNKLARDGKKGFLSKLLPFPHG